MHSWLAVGTRAVVVLIFLDDSAEKDKTRHANDNSTCTHARRKLRNAFGGAHDKSSGLSLPMWKQHTRAPSSFPAKLRIYISLSFSLSVSPDFCKRDALAWIATPLDAREYKNHNDLSGKRSACADVDISMHGMVRQ